MVLKTSTVILEYIMVPESKRVLKKLGIHVKKEELTLKKAFAGET